MSQSMFFSDIYKQILDIPQPVNHKAYIKAEHETKYLKNTIEARQTSWSFRQPKVQVAGYS